MQPERGKIQMKAAVEERTTGTIPTIHPGLVKSMQPFPSEHQNLRGAESIFFWGAFKASNLSVKPFKYNNESQNTSTIHNSPPYGLWGIEIVHSLRPTPEQDLHSSFSTASCSGVPQQSHSAEMPHLAVPITLSDTGLCWRDAVWNLESTIASSLELTFHLQIVFIVPSMQNSSCSSWICIWQGV